MKKCWPLFLVSLLLILPEFSNAVLTPKNELKEGDLISVSDYGDPDIFIINSFGYKRLFLNPVIFNFYGHLGGFQRVKKVTLQTRDSYVTSGLFRNCEVDDPKVYGVETTKEDEGNLHWVNTSGDQAVKDDPNFFKKVFCINNREFSWYPKSSDYGSVKQIPVYARTETSTPMKKAELCPDNIWDVAEQKDPGLCPEDNPANNPNSVVEKSSLTSMPLASPISSPSLSPLQSSSPQTPIISITWTKDAGTRVSGGQVPYVHKLKDGRSRMYYCGLRGSMESAISSDGLNFQAESGVRLAPIYGGYETIICDPTVVELSDGRFRLYYKGANVGGVPAIHKIFSAISPDGLNFERERLVIDSEKTDDQGWASVPEAIKLSDGRVRLYYVSRACGRGCIVSAISSDGLNFTKEETKIYDYVDPSMTQLTDGRFFLITANFTQQGGTELYSFISSDGIHFDNANPQSVIVESVADPAIVRVDDKTFRVYYWKIPDNLPTIYSITGILDQ